MTIKNKYIDPLTDFGFKRIFGTYENRKFLISFLNDLLDIEDKIVSIEYKNLEKLGLNPSDRKTIYDIYCTDEKNNNFIVELQRAKQKYFKDRSIYYTTFPIQEQSKHGDWDYKLKKVYFVGILDFTFKDARLKQNQTDTKYLTKVELKDDNNEVFYDKLSYYFLEMPKFRKQEKDLSNHLEMWLYYLTNLEQLAEIPKVLKTDDLIREAFDLAEFLAMSKDEQFAYQMDLKTRLDNKNALDYAEEKGIKKGKEMGVKENKFEVAKSLLQQNIDINVIIKSTGLTNEEIQKLLTEE
jgi:predicted transposase/invertase (TIGR01784 family)